MQISPPCPEQQSVRGMASVWGLEADMRRETRARGPPDRGTRPPRLGRAVQVIMLWARQTLWYEIIYTSSITMFLSEDYEVTIKQSVCIIAYSTWQNIYLRILKNIFGCETYRISRNVRPSKDLHRNLQKGQEGPRRTQ